MKTTMGNIMMGAMLVILLTAGIVHADLSTGLIGYWSFDNSGDLGHDYSGTGNHGSLVGNVTSTDGVSGGAAHLDGSSYLEVPDSPSLDLPGASGTISAFIRIDPSSNEFGIVSKESNTSFISTIAYGFHIVGSGVLGNFGFEISSGSSINGAGDQGASMKDSQWHHMVATFSGPGGQITIYKDGVQVAQTDQTVATVNNLSTSVYIGVWRYQGGYKILVGDIDEVRIYNRALSESEIQQLAGTIVPATVDIKPDTLDLSSTDKWVTCYIIPADDYQASDIEVDTVELENRVENPLMAQHSDLQNGVLMVKFDRQALIAYIRYVLEITPPDPCVPLTVTGKFSDGACFEGIDEIRVIDEKKKD